MSRRNTEQLTQALLSLLPTHNASSIPRPVLELATTLLLQSQAKAAHLKAEEEPARAFAACEVACQRLKTRLNLPKIESRPPCPPRTYKKLYQFLDRVLQAPLSVGDDDGKGTPNIGRIVTPSRQKTRSTAATPKSASVRTGKSILTPSKTNVYQITDEPATPSRKRKRIDDEAEGAASKIPTSARAKDGSPEPEFADALEHLDDLDDVAAGAADIEESLPVPGPGKNTGLGSLMDNQRDWLTPERRAEYKRWEARMLKRIEAIERSNGVIRAQA